MRIFVIFNLQYSAVIVYPQIYLLDLYVVRIISGFFLNLRLRTFVPRADCDDAFSLLQIEFSILWHILLCYRYNVFTRIAYYDIVHNRIIPRGIIIIGTRASVRPHDDGCIYYCLQRLRVHEILDEYI